MSGRDAILCVSSHVARGTVGNRAAAFACEALGHAVWSVPTVLLPWHPGQGPGTRLTWDTPGFAALMEDLAGSARLGELGGVLSGYLGAPSQAEAIAGVVRALRRERPDALYCCDPVIGGARGLYVPVDLAERIRDHLLPLCDLATPNRFELEWLAGAPLPDNRALARAAAALGPARVLVTSAHAEPGWTGNMLVTPDAVLLAGHERIEAPNSGTGDLTAGLLLSGLVDGLDDEEALRRATAAVLDVIRLEAERGADELPLEIAREALERPRGDVVVQRIGGPAQVGQDRERGRAPSKRDPAGRNPAERDPAGRDLAGRDRAT